MFSASFIKRLFAPRPKRIGVIEITDRDVIVAQFSRAASHEEMVQTAGFMRRTFHTDRVAVLPHDLRFDVLREPDAPLTAAALAGESQPPEDIQ